LKTNLKIESLKVNFRKTYEDLSDAFAAAKFNWEKDNSSEFA